jgi:NAD(P)-dependent dehydrogenase (short-subunit alcohol dehydrogenase family)
MRDRGVGDAMEGARHGHTVAGTSDGCRNKVAVVTGGAKGIGRATALRLAADGFDVAVLDVDDDLERVADEVRDLGRRCFALRTDVAVPEQVTEAGDAVVDSLGVPSVLVNNAAIWPRSHAVEMKWEEWQRVLGVNLSGPFLCSVAFGRMMLAAGDGAIVNISSGVATIGAVQGAHYTATKGGLISLTRSLAREWAPTVRVNVVLPGLTDTDQPLGTGMSREELYAMAEETVPLGRIGQAADIAGVVSFLVSADAAYLTGAGISANGGLVME